jgi:hypothetical protein
MNLSSASWRTSSYSSGGGNQCVEVAALTAAVAVRDSKDPGGPVHLFHPAAFHDLLARIKRGDYSG